MIRPIAISRPTTAAHVRPAVRSSEWALGWLPALSIIIALGVLAISMAHSAARRNDAWAEPVLWIGLAIIFAPAAMRLFSQTCKAIEGQGLLIALTLALYLVKVLHSPAGVTLFDEFLHVRTAADILRSGHLFASNPLLVVSPYYPGIELVTVPLVQLTGMSLFHAAVIVIGLAKIIGILSLQFVGSEVTGSLRTGRLIALIYMANPGFIFFDSMFAYESLGIPLALFVLFALVRRNSLAGVNQVALYVIALLGLFAVVFTHHITAFMLTGFMLVWGTLTFIPKVPVDQKASTRIMAVLLVAANLVWLVYVASVTLKYLSPNLVVAGQAILRLLDGGGFDRQLFKGTQAVSTTPIFERVMGYGGVLLVLGLIPLGLLRIWKQHRHNAIALALGVSALSYPATLALRLTGAGWEVANRSASFVFVAVAFVAGVAVAGLRRAPVKHLAERQSWTPPRRWSPTLPKVTHLKIMPALSWLIGASAIVVLYSGLIAGLAPYGRMPWPYTPASDSRSVEPQGVATAHWALRQLGPGKSIIADRINAQLLGSYGLQHIVTVNDGTPPSRVFLSPVFDEQTLKVIRKDRIEYTLVDRRLLNGMGPNGFYYEAWELDVFPNAYSDNALLRPDTLSKFDTTTGVNRVYDSGDISLYDLKALKGEVDVK